MGCANTQSHPWEPSAHSKASLGSPQIWSGRSEGNPPFSDALHLGTLAPTHRVENQFNAARHPKPLVNAEEVVLDRVGAHVEL